MSILDYGMGNLRSVEKALERVGAEAEITPNPSARRTPTASSCPASAPSRRRCSRCASGAWTSSVAERIAAGRPVLGICLGMQLLFDSSTETKGAAGLGLLGGPVGPIEANGYKVPHIGWSLVRWRTPSR